MNITNDECTRRFQFCSGHRVPGHAGGCSRPHGHNYVALVTCKGLPRDDGMILDFGVIKKEVGDWIDENWDHGFVLHELDSTCLEMFDLFDIKSKNPSKVYEMEQPPTAEWMAVELLRAANAVLEDHGVLCTRVRLWETENCYADAKLEEPTE